MILKVFPDHHALAQFAATQILNLVQQKPTATLCLASGETPKLTYQLVVDLSKAQGVDFSHVTFFALDEWVGISNSNPGSCHYFLTEHLLRQLGIRQEQFYYFDGLSQNLPVVCNTINSAIQKLGGLDLILVGVGLNGHVGFNEPGAPLHLHAHVAELDQITIDIGQKYFQEKTALDRGLTMGLADFFEARTAIVMANGLKKAAIIQKALTGEIGNAIPTSLIRQHKNSFVLLDAEAASELPSYIIEQ